MYHDFELLYDMEGIMYKMKNKNQYHTPCEQRYHKE